MLSCADDIDRGTRYCINDEVQYQCTAPPTLVWRVSDDQRYLGFVAYPSFATPSLPPQPILYYVGLGDFSATIISGGNPLTSNLSFNASISLNGYTIMCVEDGGPNRTCDIIIAGNFSGI